MTDVALKPRAMLRVIMLDYDHIKPNMKKGRRKVRGEGSVDI
jgi:hypothetical protein